MNGAPGILRGIYILFLRIVDDARIRVGGLGEIELEKGLYAYVGSAQNNLEKRIARHRLREKKLQWHIDYITVDKGVIVEGACAYELPREYECRVARLMEEISQKAIKGFGSSDCRCPSHLFKITRTIEEVCESVSRALGVRQRRVL
ncbi:MAG: GIY-YIG nuclease family protein [Nitrososphaerota archaeon]